MANLDFLDQIYWKRVFWLRTEKVKIIEFWIFKLVMVPNFSLKWQFWIFGPNLPNKYNVYIFGILSCISFRNHRANTVTENLKTLKILTFYQKYTIAWPKIWKLWVNSKKSEWRKKEIARRFTKVNVKRIWSIIKPNFMLFLEDFLY